jgi:hypothetical protein
LAWQVASHLLASLWQAPVQQEGLGQWQGLLASLWQGLLASLWQEQDPLVMGSVRVQEPVQQQLQETVGREWERGREWEWVRVQEPVQQPLQQETVGQGWMRGTVVGTQALAQEPVQELVRVQAISPSGPQDPPTPFSPPPFPFWTT